MWHKAVAEQPSEDGANVSASYALAVEPDESQAAVLERVLAARISGTLRVVASIDEACTALVERIPDVILMSPLLAPQDEKEIVARLGSLGVDASHVKLLSIPRVGDTAQPVEKKRRFGWQSQKDSSTGGAGFDAVAFAGEVDAYLSEASTLRQNNVTEDARPRNAERDPLPDVRIEHIEQLLERLHVDPSPQPEGEPSQTSKRDLMAIPTTHEPAAGAVRNADSRLPKFLTLDDSVPRPLRALLDEADGCLKMSFLVGAGACAGRTLDLLLAEQGLTDGERGEQILQLGKKHPAVSESFLRGLSLVMNNPTGSWDEARATLSIAILKAIAYEIYVLGPERKERAAYVIELLERYRSAGKN